MKFSNLTFSLTTFHLGLILQEEFLLKSQKVLDRFPKLNCGTLILIQNY